MNITKYIKSVKRAREIYSVAFYLIMYKKVKEKFYDNVDTFLQPNTFICDFN